MRLELSKRAAERSLRLTDISSRRDSITIDDRPLDGGFHYRQR